MSPHLDGAAAEELINKVIVKYRDERKTTPKRVVVHKSSEYRPDELAGFKAGLKDIGHYDLVALRPSSRVRMIRQGSYPPLRGTTFQFGDVTHLYTTGYIKPLELYPHGHVPSPLEICDHRGDSSMRTLVAEILTLTKLNWNSANFCGSMPITLRFSRLVGDILREVPADFEPLPKYQYYM